MGNLVIRGFGIPDHSIPSRGFTGTSAVPSILPARGITLGGDVFTILGSTLTVAAPETFPGVSLSGAWSSAATGGGTGWTLQHHFGAGRTWDVWGAAPDDVWVTNVGQFAHHWNGSTWTASDLGASEPMGVIWGFASNDVWMGGDSGLVIHWNGSAWGSFIYPGGGFAGNDILAMWGAATNDIWAVDDNTGELVHYDGASWTSAGVFLPGVHHYDMYGFAANDIWLTGETGRMHHYNGSVWSTATIGNLGTETFNSVFGVASNDVWAIGSTLAGGGSGQAYHWNGSTWTQVAVPGGAVEFRGAWGSASNDIWFGSDNGVIYHWNGTSISAYSPNFPGVSFWGMFGFGPNDIWLAAGDSNADVYHWNGTAAGGAVVVNDGLFLNLGTVASSALVATSESYKNFDVSVLYQYDNTVEQFFPTNEITYLRIRAKIDSNNYFTLAHMWNPKKGPEIRVSVTTSGVTTIIRQDTGHASSRAMRLIRFDGRMQAYAGSVLLADFRGWRTDDVNIELASEDTLSPLPLSTKVTLFQQSLLVTFGTEIAPFVNLIAKRIVGSTPAYKLPSLVEVKVHNSSSTISLGDVFTYFPPLQLTVSGLEGTSIVVNDDEQLRDSTPTLPGLRLYD